MKGGALVRSTAVASLYSQIAKRPTAKSTIARSAKARAELRALLREGRVHRIGPGIISARSVDELAAAALAEGLRRRRYGFRLADFAREPPKVRAAVKRLILAGVREGRFAVVRLRGATYYGQCARAAAKAPAPKRAAPAPKRASTKEPFTAAQLRAAAKRARKFGGDRAFIGSLWEQMRKRKAFALSLPAFKAELIRRHRAGELVLTRADLVSAMDPKDVAQSESEYLGARFHFVDLGSLA